MTGEVPDWLRPLVEAAGTVEGPSISRFLPPEDGSGRASAVLIVLSAGPVEQPDDRTDGPAVLLIERSGELRNHAGQVAFPGGALDPDDADEVAAALREANEEVGLDAGSVEVVAILPALFIPVTGFVVTPVVAWWRRPHPVAPVDTREVAGVAVVAIGELAEPANRFRVRHPSGYVGPGFEVGGLFVWGFTAGLLDRLLVLGGWARPWDETQHRDLPGHLLGDRRR